MPKTKKQLLVLKLGGSVITYKNNSRLKIRKTVLESIAKEIKSALQRLPGTDLVLVHGAGSAGHVLAKQYDLKSGVKKDAKKLKAALKIRENNQRLNLELIKIFSEVGLFVVPLHTGSVVTQKNGLVDSLNYDLVKTALAEGCIPVLYGEMVFDKTLGLSVCSGDEIVSEVATNLSASKIIYASDVDGVYEEDPFKNQSAKMLSTIRFSELMAGDKVRLGESHSVDVTGGLFNKIKAIDGASVPRTLTELIVFNGLKKSNFSKVLVGEEIGTKIYIKK